MRSMQPTISALLLSATLLCVFSVPTVAGVYRWVDENGETHYGDSIPPEYIKREHRELNQQGVTVNKVSRSKTAEELKAEREKVAEETRQAEETASKRAEKTTRDRLLLDTYLTEQDIIDLRDRKLATLEGTISISERSRESAIASLKSFENDLKDSAEGSKDREVAQKRIAETKEQITAYDRFIAGKKKEQARIKEDYMSDVNRFRELKGTTQ